MAVAQAVAGEVRPLVNYGRFRRVAVWRHIDSVLVAAGMRDARHMHAVLGHLLGASPGPMGRAFAIALVERRLCPVSRTTANVGRVRLDLAACVLHREFFAPLRLRSDHFRELMIDARPFFAP